MKFYGGKVSVGVAVALVLVSILVGLRVIPIDAVVFVSAQANGAPWTALTYPFGCGIVCALLHAMGIGSLGSAVERDIGPAKMGILFGVTTVLAALLTSVGALILGESAFLSGPWMISTCIAVAYGTRYPRTQISLMGIVTIEARWLAIGSVVLTLAAVVPMAVSIFTAVSLIFAWAFAANKMAFYPYGQPLQQIKKARTFGRGVQAPNEGYFDDVKRREKEREERERLRKLFEGSAKDDDR